MGGFQKGGEVLAIVDVRVLKPDVKKASEVAIFSLLERIP